MRNERWLNTGLAATSALTGLFLINWIIIIASNNNYQKNGFPRQLLTLIDPVARWSYPDIRQKEKSTTSINVYLVGDSYAEGSGDSFLKNEYQYSSGHFLRETIPKSIQLHLAANSGSDLPKQLDLLNKYLQGDLSPLSRNRSEEAPNSFILFFYEGNDLENVAISKKLAFDHPIKSFLRKNAPIFHVINWIATNAKQAAASLFRHSASGSNSTRSYANEVCVGNQCRTLPPMQSASAELSQVQIDSAIAYTAKEIDRFKSKHNQSSYCFIYIPSPATIYEPNEFFHENYLGSAPIKISGKLNSKKSGLMRSKIKREVSSIGIPFYDATDTLKTWADKKFVHGRIDPNHFNADGYEILAKFVATSCKLN